MSEQKVPVTKPSMLMFAPYKATIKGFIVVSIAIAALMAVVQIFVWMKI